MRASVALFTLLAIPCLAACSSDRAHGPGGDASIPDNGGHGGDGGATGSPDGEAHLEGKVVAPEGTIPIPGALVYLTQSPPAAIPDGVYCDKCVHIQDGTPYTNTRYDGTFDLPAPRGDWYLVVQKGDFRRVRKITVVGGTQQVPIAMTTLPGEMDTANGDTIPRIAVVAGAWDPIEVVLARIGLRASITSSGLGQAEVLSKNAKAFAIYGNVDLGDQSPYPSPEALLTDPSEIDKYQIVFIPCSGSPDDSGSGPTCDGVFDSDSRVKTNLEQFVRKGGKLYVSDWSYEYVRQVFPGFVTWSGATSDIGSACMNGGGDQSVTMADPDLKQWLDGQGKSLSSVKDAWTYLDGVSPQMDVDADGNPATITPKVWVEAEGRPATATFHHGCGRVLFTTYHTQPTAESSAALEPQALAMLYLVLEVGVCVDDAIPG